MTAFETGYAFTLEHERGWWPGGPTDPNPTLNGVRQDTYDRWRDNRGLPRRSVRQMDAGEQAAIYQAYWRDCRAEELVGACATAHFAFAFNAGPGAAIRCLQRALGVPVDGAWGPVTARAVRETAPAVLFPHLLCEQLAYYAGVARNPAQRPNLLSWVSRVVDAWRRYGPGTPQPPLAAA